MTYEREEGIEIKIRGNKFTIFCSAKRLAPQMYDFSLARSPNATFKSGHGHALLDT